MESLKTYRQNVGIDYGMGTTNRDMDTGIRYGVVSIHEVSQAWCDESEGNYFFGCPHCGTEFEPDFDIECECPHCRETIETEEECHGETALSFFYNADGYKAEQGGDDTDIFITDSPYFTYAQFCSPCAPGACHLGNPLDEPAEGNKCYCFGHDWFEDEKAPYKVYSVKTGKEVLPE